MTKIYLPKSAQTGIYKVAELKENDTLLADFGYSNALAVTVAMLDAANTAVTTSLAQISETTTVLTEAAPIAAALRMEEVDEFGNVRTQKTHESASRSFPMKLRAFATGWTEHFLTIGSVSQLVQMNEAAQLAYSTAVREDMLEALFNPTSRNARDIILIPVLQRRTLDGIKVVPLYNGDEEVPAPNGNGKRFGPGHNHYLVAAKLDNTAVDALAGTVTEHNTSSDLAIYINEADAGTWRALPNFAADTAGNVFLNVQNGMVSLDALNTANTGDRKIGFAQGMYPVLVKPWVPQGYAMALDRNAAKVLKRRLPQQRQLQGLRLKGQEGNTVLTARTWEAFYGFGVSNRGGAAILQYNSPDGKYHAPVMAGDEE